MLHLFETGTILVIKVISTDFVFIDTEVFVHSSFNFESRELVALREFVQSRRIVVLITDIVYRETMHRIRQSLLTAHQSLGALTQKTRVLKNLDEFQALLSNTEQVDKWVDKLQQRFDEYLKSTAIEIIPTDQLRIGPIMDLYFSGAPPFDMPKKKHELPDAISLRAVLNWAHKNKAYVVYVSNDSDVPALIKTMKADDWIGHCPTIGTLVKEIAATKELQDKVSRLLEQSTDMFEKTTFETLRHADYQFQNIEAAVEDIHLNNICLIPNIEFYDVEDDFVSCDVEIEAEYVITYRTFSRFHEQSSSLMNQSVDQLRSQVRVDRVIIEAEIEQSPIDNTWTLTLYPTEKTLYIYANHDS